MTPDDLEQLLLRVEWQQCQSDIARAKLAMVWWIAVVIMAAGGVALSIVLVWRLVS